MRDLAATLPHPPGINATYRDGRYLTAAARQWKEGAIVRLRAAGGRPVPTGRYFISLHLVLFTMRHDLDAPLKLLIDAVSIALGVDDRALGDLHVVKVPVGRRADERLDVHLTLESLGDAADWTARAEDAAALLTVACSQPHNDRKGMVTVLPMVRASYDNGVACAGTAGTSSCLPGKAAPNGRRGRASSRRAPFAPHFLRRRYA